MQDFTFDLTNYDLKHESKQTFDPDVEKGPAIVARPTTSASTASKSNDSKTEEKSIDDSTTYLTGWRREVLTFSLCLGLFLSLLETTIMSTSLLSIIDEFHEQDRSSWIITAYLLTYTGFIIPLAKLSDIYGRRPVLATSVVIFIAASAGCGWSHSMTELCIFRAFQGIGGGGIFALTFILLPEMVPRELYNRYSVIMSTACAFGNLLGPILGGVINNSTTWRWIFWLNIPAGVVALAGSWLALPAHYPYHRQPSDKRPSLSIRSLRRIDFPGAFLILSASCLLVACLEVGGSEYAWDTATPLSLLLVSILCWVLLLRWQFAQSKRPSTPQEPVLPWRILTDRFVTGLLLISLVFGAAFFAVVINLPLRFQVVDGNSPLTAGYKLLPVTVITPVGSVIAGHLSQSRKVPPIYLLIAGGALQTLGTGLYAGLDAGSLEQHGSQYAFELLLGIGFGITLNTAIIMVPFICKPQDVAIGMAFIGQFRALGGSIGIAGCANLLNKVLSDDLAGLVGAGHVSPQQLQIIKGNAAELATLPADVRVAFVEAYADGFRKEMWLVTGFCAACVLGAFMLVERRPRRCE